MHEQFIKYGSPAIRLIEECSELIKEVCKGERFGYDDYNPLINDSLSNRQKISSEMEDVELAMNNLKKYLDELPYDVKREPEGDR